MGGAVEGVVPLSCGAGSWQCRSGFQVTLQAVLITNENAAEDCVRNELPIDPSGGEVGLVLRDSEVVGNYGKEERWIRLVVGDLSL